LAYPDTDHKTRELISCDYFIDALADPELGLKIRERQPTDLDSALHIALQLEVWTKDSERMSQAMAKLPIDNKKVREFSQGNASAKQWKDAASAKKDMDEQRRLFAEQMKWMEHVQKTLESLGAMKVNADTPRPSPSSGSRSQ